MDHLDVDKTGLQARGERLLSVMAELPRGRTIQSAASWRRLAARRATWAS
jgi:hypothetical protein